MTRVKLQFTCINDGIVDKDFVSFLCNRCGGKTIKIDGLYICETCFEPGARFECRLCGEDDVSLEVLNIPKPTL